MEQHRLCQGPTSLPSELWLKIFAMATRLPGDLIVAPPYRIEACPHPSTMHSNRDSEETTRLKLDLVLVCRSWRQMATQFLYEIINMRLFGDPLGYKRVKALLSIFKISASANGANGDNRKTGWSRRVPEDGRFLVDKGAADKLHHVEHGHGRWVKQLSFHTESVSVACVAAIVGHCPNLRTLIVDNAHIWREAKIHCILLPAIPASLRRLEIHDAWSGNTIQKFGTVLRRCPSIRAATLDCTGADYFGNDPNRQPLLQLTDLTLLYPEVEYLDALMRWMPKLPYLTHLTLDWSRWCCRTDILPQLVAVIKHLCPQLLFLDVRPSWGVTDVQFIQLCEDISASCLRLRGFVLRVEHALLPRLRFQSLTHLVIPNYHNRNFSINAKMRNILDLEVPALTCVRILAGRDLQQSFTSGDWVGAYSERGIRVEDEDGMDLLHQPL